MDQEVNVAQEAQKEPDLRLSELSMAAMHACWQAPKPVPREEIQALAPEIDDAYEEAAGLKGDVQPEVRPMLEGLIPSVEYRRGLAELLALHKRFERFLLLDFSLWENVIAYAMAEAMGIRPTVRAVRLKRQRRDIVRQQTPVLARFIPAAKVRA